tara:strand:+ start:484 stop:711 length:228 start_codon:yes stop_codon:yes gene_type:complete
MTSLKGVKAMSVGNGSADLFQISELRVSNVKLGFDLILPDNRSLVDLLRSLMKEVGNLSTEVKDLREKLDNLETE